MTKEEAIKVLMWVFYKIRVVNIEGEYDTPPTEEEIKKAGSIAIEALEQETIESIPYLMHKEMGIPLIECKKAYDLAIEYLRDKASVKG